MAYKFQLGAARLSGSTTFEESATFESSVGALSLSASAGVSGKKLTIDSTEVLSSARQLKNIASLDATTEATIEAAVDTLDNLASAGQSGNELEFLGSIDAAEGIKIANASFADASRNISVGTVAATGLANLNAGIEIDNGGNKFTVSNAGVVVAEGSVSGAAGSFDAITGTSLALQGGGVSAAGAIAGATTIDATGKLTVGGVSDLDGGIDVNASKFTVSTAGAVVADSSVSGAAGSFDAITGTSLSLQGGGLTGAGAIAGATSVDGTGDLTMGTITMTGFSVDADGDLAAKSLSMPNGASIGAGTDAVMLTFNEASDIGVASDLDFIVAEGKLKLGSDAVTATADEINVLDGALAGSGVASKALVLDSNKRVSSVDRVTSADFRFSEEIKAGTSISISGSGVISGSGNFSAGGDATVQGQLQLGGLFKMADNTAGKLLIGDNTSYEEVALQGDASLVANGTVTLGVSSISGKSELASDGLAAADELMIRDDDADSLKKIGVDNLFKDGPGLLAAENVDVGADHIMFLDGAANGDAKIESIEDLVSAMAGAGLASTGGVLRVQGSSVSSVVSGSTLSEGYNFVAADATGSAGMVLPAGPSVGDVVVVKAKDGVSQSNFIEVKAQGSHLIDGASSVRIESPFGAVSCVYVVANDWRIV